MKKLTVVEVKAIAMKYYEQGGDGIIECYDDPMIEEWIEDNGTEYDLMRLFDLGVEQMASYQIY